MSRWIALGLLVGTAVAGQERPLIPTDGDDTYAECKEDCLIRWGGGTDLKKRAKNNQCINACSKVELECRETFFETKRNNLDEGSIAGTPNSRDVDSDGLPTKTAKKAEPKPRKEEDLRDEPAEKPKKEERAAEPKRELAAEETPKSTCTQLKADPKEKPAEKPAPEKAPEKREEPKPAPVEEAAPPPAPPKKEKKEEKREEPKEKKRSLDEWDPDAL